jgi:hypothetical protein
MLSGSCLCGGIKYEIEGELFGALNCRCSMCRKAQGAAFGVSVADSHFIKSRIEPAMRQWLAERCGHDHVCPH